MAQKHLQTTNPVPIPDPAVTTSTTPTNIFVTPMDSANIISGCTCTEVHVRVTTGIRNLDMRVIV